VAVQLDLWQPVEGGGDVQTVSLLGDRT
jgi:hypothetical protein